MSIAPISNAASSRWRSWDEALPGSIRGTPDSLLGPPTFVRTVEKRQGLRISSLEEIAFRMGFIDQAQLVRSGDRFGEVEHGHLRLVAEGGH